MWSMSPLKNSRHESREPPYTGNKTGHESCIEPCKTHDAVVASRRCCAGAVGCHWYSRILARWLNVITGKMEVWSKEANLQVCLGGASHEGTAVGSCQCLSALDRCQPTWLASLLR